MQFGQVGVSLLFHSSETIKPQGNKEEIPQGNSTSSWLHFIGGIMVDHFTMLFSA